MISFLMNFEKACNCRGYVAVAVSEQRKKEEGEGRRWVRTLGIKLEVNRVCNTIMSVFYCIRSGRISDVIPAVASSPFWTWIT